MSYSYVHQGETIVCPTQIRYGVTCNGLTVLPTRKTKKEAINDLKIYAPELYSKLGFLTTDLKVSKVEAYTNGQTIRVLDN